MNGNLETYNVYGQIINILTKESEIELPKIFKQAQDENSKLYTEEEFTLENCTLNETKDKVIINEGVEEATVTINGGKLSVYDSNKSILHIKVDKIPPELKIAYDNTNLTNKPVIATITSNEEIQEVEGWQLGEDKKTLTKEYTQNTNELVTVKDLAGNESQINVNISNIDLESPKLEIKYSTANLTNGVVTATIEANEEIQEVEGWTLEENNRTLTKVYAKNTTEKVSVEDLAGNNSEIDVNIQNIDKDFPQIEIKYSTTKSTNKNVTVTIISNEEIQEVEGWILEKDKKTLVKEYKENSKEKVMVRDIAGNEKEIPIEIENIDKVAPKVKVVYNTKENTIEPVTVIIETDEEVQKVEGWTLGKDRKSLTKDYEKNTNEKIVVYDLAGNSTEVEINIDNIITENSNNKSENTAPFSLPKAGENIILISLIIIISVIAIILKIKLKSYKDIK